MLVEEFTTKSTWLPGIYVCHRLHGNNLVFILAHDAPDVHDDEGPDGELVGALDFGARVRHLELHHLVHVQEQSERGDTRQQLRQRPQDLGHLGD